LRRRRSAEGKRAPGFDKQKEAPGSLCEVAWQYLVLKRYKILLRSARFHEIRNAEPAETLRSGSEQTRIAAQR
jgi:hypothetical protein